MKDMVVADNIKMLRQKFNLSQEQLAEIAGVTNTAVSSWERGVSEPRMGAVQRIADYFGIDNSNIINRDGMRSPSSERTGFVSTPLYGAIAAGDPLEMINSDDSHPVPSEMVRKHPRAFLLTVKGSSMDKVVPNGAYALIDPDADVFDGDPVAVNINGFDATLKRYYKLTNGVLLKPDSSDPTHKEYLIDFSSPNAENVRVLGKLVWYAIPFDFKF